MSQELQIPAVSVILPVYNAEKTVEISIRSILGQTFREFELIIIDDGSTDKSAEVIRSISDARIVFLQQQNMGLAATLNRAIAAAKAPLIARQDNDDVSYPERLRKQVDWFENNPDLVLLGTAARIVDHHLKTTGRFHRHESTSAVLKADLLFDNPFVHSSVMFRKSAWQKCGPYNTDPGVFEDYDMWSKMADCGEIANIEEVLLDYRESPAGMSKTSSDYEQKVQRTSIQNILKLVPELKSELLENFVSGNMSATDYSKLLSLLTEKAAKQYGLDNIQREALFNRRKAAFLRNYYNRIIKSDNSGAVVKLRARLLRYLLFKKQSWS